ncbi:arginase family protein, partial [Candidatus Woesearchaeota archaeon]|nr:arginase family protein [Candidatus Woesearchaeota archaeon]
MKIIKVPFSASALSKSKGLEKGPDRICAQLGELFANESGRTAEFEFAEVKVDNTNVEDSHQAIFERLKKVADPAILLGGDHSITFSAFKAFASNNPGAGLLVFDAHPDCENHFVPPTHEDYLRSLIEEGILEPKKVIIIGLRNWHKNEVDFIGKKGI